MLRNEKFEKQKDGTFKVTLNDLENKLKILIINLEFDSKESKDSMYRLSVGNKILVKQELNTDEHNDSKLQVLRTFDRHGRDIMEVYLTGDFKKDSTCILWYNFTDSSEVDEGLPTQNPFVLHDY